MYCNIHNVKTFIQFVNKEKIYCKYLGTCTPITLYSTQQLNTKALFYSFFTAHNITSFSKPLLEKWVHNERS